MTNNVSNESSSQEGIESPVEETNIEQTDVSSDEPKANLPFNYKENKIANFLAIVAALLFAVGIGFLVYKQFISTKIDLAGNFKEEISEEAAKSVRDEPKVVVNKEKNVNVVKIVPQDQNSDTTDKNTNTESNNYPDKNNGQINDSNTGEQDMQTDQQTLQSQGLPGSVGVWTANDYSQGQIKKGSYTVKSGDTLWEIAEAVYGDGSQWVKILSANSGSIGYLPSGQQALIYAGQTLVIP